MLYSEIITILAVLIVLNVYSLSKASTAYFLGDRSYNIRSRLTFNPLKAIEPIGFILFVAFGFGWADPIYLSNINIKDRARAIKFITIIPNLALLMLIFFLAIINNFIPYSLDDFTMYIQLLIFKTAIVSASYILINILPIAPFDGFTLLTAIGKPDLRVFLSNYEKMFQIIFIIALTFGFFGLTFFNLSRFIVTFIFELI